MQAYCVRGVRIPACGHTFVPGSEPSYRNCEPCWFAFYQTHGEYTKNCDELFHDAGIDGLKQVIGTKAAKFYLRFMGALAYWQQMVEKAGESNGVSDSTGNSTGTAQDAL